MRLAILFFASISGFLALSQAKTYDFPNPVDTKTKEIKWQEKKTYQVGTSLFVDNQFDGARLNKLTVENDSTVTIFIEPENTPINMSPWYAFRLWTSEGSKNVTIKLDYFERNRHRYWPKVSSDGNTWNRMDSTNVSVATDTLTATLKVNVGTDTTWIAAQPLETSSKVETWSREIAKNKLASFEVIGKSKQGRDLYHIRLGKGKETVVVISRQHPPEVTGYYAMQSFIERIADNSKLSKSFLKKYTVLIYPLLNPDGVDMGHWRHNTGGVDLNRDWAHYNQSEIKQFADHIVKDVTERNSQVAVGLDFHSTYYDIYYTTDRELETVNQSFTDDWLSYIGSNIENYEIHDAPSGLGSPVSKGWFITQFNAPGITFEIGDNTPPEFITKKGKVAAEGMMKVLLEAK